ncbi:hypothetical protein JHK82_050720 [Glycine max]|uniref:MI domain-containing protein n=1 Tax=Glycine max TaxID=3847 RepID=I1N2B5_SOYBN|nr:hypothetical protein JHK86_050588 [Glycine max]KAG4924871.1 hypothetical protein JHK87_050411 [Glycine soja]KAG4936511.1 hypothetical protein JHK85_051430 [Glycine max]KAG5091942.1 hypothetical protein JHK82_050720 [Glycine max]KAG5095037.1 hypothetical protein JHK84_050625 [Glycine max]
MEFMLEIVCDIKNNKRKPNEDSHMTLGLRSGYKSVEFHSYDASSFRTDDLVKFSKLRVDDILIRGFKWSKLLDPDKKGQWWLSGDVASSTGNVEEVANRIDKDVHETQRMLQLAAAQKMNTNARREIFCIIMSGEDYLDAFEKLLRLELPGKQDRDIMWVLVECCLQEKVFNKYYTVLASKNILRLNSSIYIVYMGDSPKGMESTELLHTSLVQSVLGSRCFAAQLQEVCLGMLRYSKFFMLSYLKELPNNYIYSLLLI